MFDTSNYPNDLPSGIEAGVNKMVIGKFKDEEGGLIIEEFVGLRSKLYSLSLWEKKRRYVKESREKYLKIMLVLMTIKSVY